MRRNLTFPLVFGIIGSVIIVTAVFADRLGMDPSQGWGRLRIAFLIFGVCITLAAFLFWRFTTEVLVYLSKIWTSIVDQPIIARVRRSQSIVYFSGLLKKYWFAIPILVLVTLIYIWFISSGTWTTWVSPTHLYADLTRGFLKGKLYLPIKVSQNLLNSPDPYDISAGLGVQGPLDVSYFQGKYYLYWGPVPALILLLLHPIISWRLGDLQLLFGFLTGLFILQCILAIIIWDRFFNNLPKYILGLSILLAGLASPATFMLDSARGARIYEAAITGGQFFLVGGFITAIFALGPPVSRWRLAVAGSMWALAIGTRLILALPIGFMVLMAAWWIMSGSLWSFKKIIDLISIGLPLALGFMFLGWYNWARFGSITESGFYYAMTAIPNFQEHFQKLINPIFILQNLYNYFLFPFSIRTQFPYIFAEYGNIKAVFSSYSLPLFYFSQKITGLVYTIPFLVFAIIPLATLSNYFFNGKAVQKSSIGDEPKILNWITLALIGSGLLTFSLLLSYFWAATRFLEDVMPAFLTLSMIGFWQGYQWLLNRPVGKKFYTAVGIILLAGSLLISTLVAISVNDARFEIIRLLK
jgi:hypothetical protein